MRGQDRGKDGLFSFAVDGSPLRNLYSLGQTISAVRLGAPTYNFTVLYTYVILLKKSLFYHFRRAGVPLVMAYLLSISICTYHELSHNTNICILIE